MKNYKSHIFLLMFGVALMVSAGTFAQIQISGKVYDESKNPLPGVNILLKGSTVGTMTDIGGAYRISVPDENSVLVYSFIGYENQEITVKNNTHVDVYLKAEITELQEVVITSPQMQKEKHSLSYSVNTTKNKRRSNNKSVIVRTPRYRGVSGATPAMEQRAMGFADSPTNFNTEEYDGIEENTFLAPDKNPLSTFSIDVDAASYSNIRRFLNNGQRPPKDAVRIEEMVNYFTYEYAQPTGEDPFSIQTEFGICPWNEKHQLVHIGLQGKKIPMDNLPPSNLVFLIDVSGSMGQANKLPLLKSSFKMLVQNLRKEDRVAMVVYAGAAGMVLPSTPGDQKEKIISALDNLNAGGSTAGGEGIKLAYKIAKENFRQGGNNRVILATDGDFNIGESSNAAMERLIEEKREDKIFLTVLGFGMGNYKDSKMETIADKGNGNYAYIDNIQEAKKVLINEFGGTLFTIAKDVKLQIEFNPAKVQAYRLIGYENRKLNKEDFNDDKKDAGDLGAGHTVTALYEIIPAGVESDGFIKQVDDLKYQKTKDIRKTTNSDEILTLKLRYKQPTGDDSKLLVTTLKGNPEPLDKTSDNFRFSAAVAAYGMILRESEFKGNADLPGVVALAKSAIGKDEAGYRAEFLKMVRSSDFLASR